MADVEAYGDGAEEMKNIFESNLKLDAWECRQVVSG